MSGPNSVATGRHSFLIASRFLSRLVEQGLDLVIASPGSRSTPLIVAADRTAGVRLEIVHDERVAGFMALGYAKQTRRPAALICTSGSAGSHYLPAILEAHSTGVPLIALTADRPSYLQGKGAPQTVDQSHFFDGYTRLTRLLDDIENLDASDADVLGDAVWKAAVDQNGPVHVNWPFAEPLEPGHGKPETGSVPSEHPETKPPSVDSIPALEMNRGVIVVGPDDYDPDTAQAILAYARDRGWPVLADIGSGLRSGHGEPLVVPWIEPAFEPDGLADHNPPDVVLRIGRMPTAKAFSQWLLRNQTAPVVVPIILVDDHAEVHDFTDTASEVVRFPPAVAVPMLPKPGTTEPDWAALWVRASAAAEEIQVAVGTEPAIVADLLHRLPAGSSLHLANSMPIRHADGFGGVLANDVRVHVSRGTNGIDGTIATALGEAMAGQPAVAVVGDIAFLHDIGGLMAAGRSEENLTVVVIDNGGGSIFSFLPIAQDLEPSEFDRLFNTPHDTRVRQVTEAAGGRVVEQLDEAITRAGLDVIVIETDSEASVTAFRSARTAMTEAMRNG